MLPDQHGRSDMLIQSANRIAFLGQPADYFVTNNGQYVFTTITRKKFELDAMRRAVEICKSSSKLLKDAQADLKCNDKNTQFKPRRPSLSDFIQVASLCLPGMSCPKM